MDSLSVDVRNVTAWVLDDVVLLLDSAYVPQWKGALASQARGHAGSRRSRQRGADIGSTIQTGWPITSWSTTDNHYAANGQLTWSKRRTSEDVHRTDKLFLKTYGYTKLVADPSLGRGVYEENRYDALGRRVWVRELRDRYCTAADRTATSECLGAVTRTIWDGDRVLYEIRQPGDSGTAPATMESDVASTAHNAFYGIAEYTHGDDLDEPLGMIRDTSGVLTLVLHRQWRGQVDQSTWAVSGAKAECATTGQKIKSREGSWTNHIRKQSFSS